MKKIKLWKIIYAVCCLIYMGWTINVGTNEFDRVNSQYRAILAQLDQDSIKTKALEELIAECNKESALQADRQEDACLSWPPEILEAREKKIEKRLLQVRERGRIKLVLFYAGFLLIFLLAPTVLIYLLIIGVIKLKENIKIVR